MHILFAVALIICVWFTHFSSQRIAGWLWSRNRLWANWIWKRSKRLRSRWQDENFMWISDTARSEHQYLYCYVEFKKWPTNPRRRVYSIFNEAGFIMYEPWTLIVHENSGLLHQIFPGAIWLSARSMHELCHLYHNVVPSELINPCDHGALITSTIFIRLSTCVVFVCLFSPMHVC